MVNDESAKCREMAALLIKALLEKCEQSVITTTMQLLNEWYESNQIALCRASLQVYSIMIESALLDKNSVNLILNRLSVIILEAKSNMKLVNWTESSEETIDTSFPNWQSGYYAMITFEKMMNSHQHASFSQSRIWDSLVDLMSHPQDWIRKSAIRIYSNLSLFVDGDSLIVKNTSLIFSFIQTPENTINITRKLVSQLLRSDLDSEVANHIVKGLFFLSKYIHANKSVFDMQHSEDKDEQSGSNIGYLCRLVKKLCVMCRKASIYMKDVTNLMVSLSFHYHSSSITHLSTIYPLYIIYI